MITYKSGRQQTITSEDIFSLPPHLKSEPAIFFGTTKTVFSTDEEIRRTIEDCNRDLVLDFISRPDEVNRGFFQNCKGVIREYDAQYTVQLSMSSM